MTSAGLGGDGAVAAGYAALLAAYRTERRALYPTIMEAACASGARLTGFITGATFCLPLLEDTTLDSNCPNCHALFAENAKYCSSCGFSFTQEMRAVGLALPALRTPSPVTLGEAPPANAYNPSTSEPIERLSAALEGRYVVERVLGRGGMATVYLAKDARHEREVAIKVLLPELSASIGSERFEREIRLAAKLQHPHILGLFDSGSALGLLYYVMPFVKGESLRDRIDREGQLPIEDAIGITLEVADALGHAHAQGIVHRDIKPENIMLSGGHALVADFGIARAATDAGVQKLTQTGMALGTPLYMSPEQAGGEEVGPPADIYSLACVLYEMLAGEPPFAGKNSLAIMARHAMEQVPSIRIVRNSVPEEVEEAIFAGMGKVPADRPKTALEFAEILGMPMGMTTSLRTVAGRTSMRRVLTGPHGARTVSFGHRRGVAWWRRPSRITFAVVVAAAAVGGVLALKKGPAPVTDENERRVAVLYFTDQSKTKDLGPIADGLTEDLINSLSNASSITLISRSGVERFRGADVSSDSIARALRAGYLVRGDLDREAGKILVNVRLLDRVGGLVQGTSLSIDTTNQLVMRDSLQTVVSAFLKGKLHQEIRVREERSATQNQEAWLDLQRAEQARKDIAGLLAKGDTAAVDRAVAAVDSTLAHAEKLDPKWAEPVIRRAMLAYQRSRTIGRDPGQIRKWVDQGLGHANRALALDGDLPDALEMRGTLKYWAWFTNLETDVDKKKALLKDAQADLEKSTRLNPKQASAFATLASLYYQVENATPNDVYIAATKAYEADEFLANANVVLHRLFNAAYDLNQFDKASQHCKTFSTRFPLDYRSKRCRLFLLTMPLAPALDLAEARHIADSVVAMRPPKDSLYERLNTNLLVAGAMARAGKLRPALVDSARQLARSSLGSAELDPNRDLTFYAAFVYTKLGDTDGAIRLLKEYLAVNPQRAISIREDPGWWFEDLKNNAQFKQLVGAQ